MRLTIKLSDELEKKVAWDSIDGATILSSIDDQFINSDFSVLELDLEEIVCIDTLFVQNVILYLLNEIIAQSNGTKAILLSNTDNEDILYLISKVLKENHSFILHRRGELLNVIGNNSLVKGRISRRLQLKSEFQENEISISAPDCKLEFEEFVKLGYLKKKRNQNYISRLVDE